jgi:hypothetical protein
MRKTSLFKTSIASLLAIILFSCGQKEFKKDLPKISLKFDTNSLIGSENDVTKKVRGQVLYLPVYSNIPYLKQGKQFDLSAFVAIHNTDFTQTMKVTKVLFFDNDGKRIENYLSESTVLSPLGATTFFVPERNQSGTGANFIIEWVSDTPINEPLIESVNLGLSNGQGVSFLSSGKILRELK